MALEIEGKLFRKFDTERKTDSFQAREFVLEIESGNYSEYIKFQLVQDKCSVIDSFIEGARLKVHFNLRGREWQGKFLTNLNAWRVENADTATATPVPQAAAPASAPATQPAPFPTAEPPGLDSASDDLPF
ncbi:MAG: hypothetical protein RLZZ292_2467 [Bacteroidota bacterium]|jgi:hypothetical protein